MEQPVFVVGTGRSGSTVFGELLCTHPELAWLSATLARYPNRPEWNRWLLRATDLPWIGRALRRRVGPVEPYAFWDWHFRGFSRPFRDLQAFDVTEKARSRIRDALEQVTTRQRTRVLAKITGWPRIGFLNEIFPDAKFVHVVRDGRAVANSLLEVDFWLGWRGPENWRFGPLPPAVHAEWEQHDRSFVALAALTWRLLVDAAEEARKSIPEDRYKEVRYEALCEDPVSTYRDVVEFCGLPWTSGFERHVRSNELRSANDKWRENLTLRQQGTLHAVLREHLRRYGYTD